MRVDRPYISMPSPIPLCGLEKLLYTELKVLQHCASRRVGFQAFGNDKSVAVSESAMFPTESRVPHSASSNSLVSM